MLDTDGAVAEELETTGASSDVAALRERIAATRPTTLVAAGGDGTVRDAAQALVDAGASACALAILPLGTANNVARALGLPALRRHGPEALALAIATARSGALRGIDLGWVDGRVFVGSFALGMDADILALRNRLRRRFRLGPALGGYPLYLASCALSLLAPRHGARARWSSDGTTRTDRLYNLLVTNVPLYAGEFRFDVECRPDDGLLELHHFAGAVGYVRGYVGAWRRHLRLGRGVPARPPRELARVRELAITLATPIACQLDGEEGGCARDYAIRVLPRALTLRVPAAGAVADPTRTG